MSVEWLNTASCTKWANQQGVTLPGDFLYSISRSAFLGGQSIATSLALEQIEVFLDTLYDWDETGDRYADWRDQLGHDSGHGRLPRIVLECAVTAYGLTWYQAGRCEALRTGTTPDEYLMWRYRAAEDCHAHRAFDGVVLPPSHPWWKVNFPPNDLGCYCAVERADDIPVPSGVAHEKPQVAASGWTFSVLEGPMQAVAKDFAAKRSLCPDAEYQPGPVPIWNRDEFPPSPLGRAERMENVSPVRLRLNSLFRDCLDQCADPLPSTWLVERAKMAKSGQGLEKRLAALMVDVFEERNRTLAKRFIDVWQHMLLAAGVTGWVSVHKGEW